MDKNSTEIVNNKKIGMLFNAASKLDTHELLQYSVMNQIPLDAYNQDGECLLHIVIDIDPKNATEHAKLNVIKFLVQNKVHPDRPNKSNQTPLHFACKMQLSLIVQYLLEIGADPNYRDSLGLTPFHYLLNGDIKLIEKTSQNIDFILPPKNINSKHNDNLIKLNSLIKQLIKDLNFPLIQTINSTIDNIYTEDQQINERIRAIHDLQLKAALDATSKINSTELININRKYIYDNIVKLLNNLSDLNNFELHDKASDSWTPIQHPSLSLIVGGNIKKTIKQNMFSLIDELEELNSSFKIIKFKDNYIDNGFNDLVKEYIIDANILKFGHINGIHFDNNSYRDNIDLFNKQNDLMRHYLAIDNASDIIDFTNLKYAGGPRNVQIHITNPGFPNTVIPAISRDFFLDNYFKDHIKKELTDILDIDNEDKQILYLLGSPIQLATINGIGPDNVLDNLQGFYDSIQAIFLVRLKPLYLK
jgi:hypothetical protein